LDLTAELARPQDAVLDDLELRVAVHRAVVDPPVRLVVELTRVGADDDCAQRPDHIGEAERAESDQQRYRRVFGGKEDLRERVSGHGGHGQPQCPGHFRPADAAEPGDRNREHVNRPRTQDADRVCAEPVGPCQRG
jgi:hypothetical protein